MHSNELGQTQQESEKSTPQKIIHLVQKMPNLPNPFEIRDWHRTALEFDRFVFDFNLEGDYLPLIWRDRTHYNMDEDTFGLMSYVGKHIQGGDGTQEAITCMGAVLGATLAGIDKSNQDGNNFVKMLQTFYNKQDKVFVWFPNVPAGDSFWYEIQSHALYYALAYFYPNEPEMERIMRESADRWVEAVDILKDETGRPNFGYASFDFRNMEPIDNGKWKEPDAASGVAMLMYMAYSRFGDPVYLKTAEQCMEFLERQTDSPYYELLMYYSPYLAARMDVEQGKCYDVGKFLNWIFEGGTQIRPDWGMCTERWANYDMHGLVGNLKDYGGYIFLMNGFHLFSTLAPFVRYDPRYARDVAKWMLNFANQAKLFYVDGLPAENQSGADWKGDPNHVIPYEGLRKEYEGKSPYASGDPTVLGWGKTDFSLYSGSHVGFMGGLVEKTNVEGIMKIDCLKTDYYHREAYPTYLYFNPFGSEETVEVTGLGDEKVDLYDTVKGTFVARGAVRHASFVLPSHHAAVIVVVPAGGEMERRNGQLWIDGVFVAPAPKPAVNLRGGLVERQKIRGVLKLDIEALVPEGEQIENIKVTFGRTELFSGKELPRPFYLDTDRFHNGLYHLRAELQSSGGSKDATEIGLIVENPTSELSAPN
ncbi:hypothetical protein [Cohnella candidum]|uniref:D-glucuronyl C5-epimerase C-terminal domain-containing protein n=1 Tax=Cohnella candidum TaxID=2674991 RepID=A0A3G3K2K3_9BACL|nr:hypothetical protein [Cohnella candidum]AYQ74009.1 hypothetical protein EAV92_16345 [Cohnella candidum]